MLALRRYARIPQVRPVRRRAVTPAWRHSSASCSALGSSVMYSATLRTTPTQACRGVQLYWPEPHRNKYGKFKHAIEAPEPQFITAARPCADIGGKRDARPEPVSQAVTLARAGRKARFSDKSHLDRIREERVTPLVQGSLEVRLGVDCSTFAIAPFSSVGIERKVSHVVFAGLFPMVDRQ